MKTTKAHTEKIIPAQQYTLHSKWQRIALLSIIGFEAAGSLWGGILLIAAPDGRYMQMPADIMHGVFPDFLIPGIILLGMGILGTFSFLSVLKKSVSDWFMACLFLGGLYIWFVVEIAILRELHWLRAMWGLPVLLGWVVTIPLIILRHPSEQLRRALLSCGILSSLWYVAVNLIVPLQYDNYSYVTHTISELSAIGAPSRVLWVLMCMPYPLLLMAFGWAVLQSAKGKPSLRAAGIVTIIYATLNFYWPPMHMREALAAGQGNLSDTLHIGWAMMTLLFNMLLMGLGAAALGKRFRVYTIATFIAFIVFGLLIAVEAPAISSNLPTPGIGIWERLNIAAFMLWIVVFASRLLKKQSQPAEHTVVQQREKPEPQFT